MSEALECSVIINHKARIWRIADLIQCPLPTGLFCRLIRMLPNVMQRHAMHFVKVFAGARFDGGVGHASHESNHRLKAAGVMTSHIAPSVTDAKQYTITIKGKKKIPGRCLRAQLMIASSVMVHPLRHGRAASLI